MKCTVATFQRMSLSDHTFIPGQTLWELWKLMGSSGEKIIQRGPDLHWQNNNQKKYWQYRY